MSVALVAAPAVVLSGPVVAAAAPAVAPSGAIESGSRPDGVSAAIAARSLGRAVEVSGATSETLRRWANPDGTFTDELAVAPVRVRRGDEWVDVDTRLASRDGAVRPAATVGDVSFSAGGAGPLASVAHGGRSVTLGWSGVLPAPVVDGSTARYVDALPGVDVELHALRAGFEQSFVLKTRAAASSAARLRLPLSSPGLSPRTRRGVIAFTDPGGVERAWVGSARMWDATGREAPVGVAVVESASGRMLEMTPDAAFLGDPSLVFPVTVDPSVTVYKWRDAYINSGASSTNYGSNAYLKTGTRSGSTNQYVSYLEFPLKRYAGKHITNVNQYLGTVDSVTCAAKTTSLYTVTTEWFESTVTWSNRPTTDLSGAGLLAQATTAGGGPSGSSCQANAWMVFNDARLTAKYQYWADNDASNFGMGIRVDSSDTQAAKDFASGENSSWTPRVGITYNSYPATVDGRSVSPALVASDGTRYASSLRPTLHGGACDPDGTPTRVDFELWDATKTTRLQYSPDTAATVASCASASWTVPADLTDGSTYYWRARAYDGTDFSKAWSSWSPVVVDTTAPVTPGVSSSAFTNGQWTTADAPAAGSFTFTLSPSSSTDVAGYYYGLDDATVPLYTTGTSASVSVNEGWHTLYVRSADRAGNRSPVAQFTFGHGRLGITKPTDGARTAQQLAIEATANSNVGSVTWKRVDGSGALVALTQLKDALGNPVTQPLTVTSGVVPAVTWDLETELGNVPDGPVQIRGVVTASGGGVEILTRAVEVLYDRTDFAAVNATAPAGPGAVNLVTGNLQVSATDATLDAYGADLNVGRTFNSRDAGAQPNGPFGPGWAISTPVEAAGSDYTELAVSGTTATLTFAGGDTIGFTRPSTSATVFAAELGWEELALTYVAAAGSDPARYEVKDLDGNVTRFTSVGGKWLPTAVLQAGDTSSTTYAHETVTVNGVQVSRVTGIMAPEPPGLSGPCLLGNPTAVVGCRSLKLTYAAATVTPPGAGQVGDFPHRLKTIEAVAYNPDATPAGMRTVAIASYSYDSAGRLREAWDPRLPALKTSYTYNADGQLATITPPAEEPWTLAYAPLGTEPAGTGRLKSVSRPTLLASPAPATATTTVVYRVPTSGTGAPYDLSPAQLDRTGQTDRPVTATAVFPPTTTATFGSGSLPVPSSYDRATVHYLNVEGREVNTADANGGIATTEHDARGNVVRTLTAGNRQRALDRGASSVDEAALAYALSSLTVYSGDGIDVAETFGPERAVTLASGETVRAREHVTNTYDEGMTGGPYHLVTTTVTGLRVAGESTDRAGESRTTKTEYGSTAAQWTLGLPTATIVDAVTGGLNLTTRTTYTTDGRVLTQTLPAGGASTNTAATRVTRYYSAGVDSVDAACGLKPEWVHLVCSVGPGGQPATGPALPTTYTTYDLFNQPRTVTEKSGVSTLRTTTTTYDSAGRPSRASVTGTGTALATQETYYDGSGRATETRTLDNLGAVTARVTRVYNTLGQLTSYTDTDGTTSTTTYDVAGRPVTTSDGKGTQTRGYDAGSERRGLVTSLADSHAGTWAASYDVDGTATVDWPNGLRATTAVDETGSETALTYAATSGCTGADCTVFTETVQESAHGQWLTRQSTYSTQQFGYDAGGRLTSAADISDGHCTTRRYTFDAGAAGNSNRTKLERFDPAISDGSCQTTTAGQTVNSAFDAADRITTTGIVYDALGRTTTVPDADALDAGNVTVGYHVNDLVHTIRLGTGTTSTYTLDVDQQRVRSWAVGSATRTHHYDGDGDNPSWTAEGGSAWTRNIGGITGDLAAIHHSASGTALQLTNLHGDVVTTTPTSSTLPSGSMETTEYGAPRPTENADGALVDNSTGTRYAWLGGKQRATDTPAGLSIMGVRLYNPATGRFLQVDPVYGGNANAYTYPDDPITTFDLDGRHRFRDLGGGGGYSGYIRINFNWFRTGKPPARKAAHPIAARQQQVEVGSRRGTPVVVWSQTKQAARQKARGYAGKKSGRCKYRGLCGSGDHYHVDKIDAKGNNVGPIHYKWRNHVP